jgi:branched-chain amino acid transport system ATP-binding protein
MSILLSAENLVSGYLNRPVLHGVSLKIPAGSVLAVIGPNGHGKTTLLRTLSGLLTVTAGTIHFDGQDISKQAVHRRVELGLIHVPQGDQLFAEMTVEENLRMGAYLVPDAATTEELLTKVYALFPKLAERRNQLTSSLSGGERRMVGVGRGLMSDGRLIMLDEPSLGLAPKVIEEIYAGLAAMRKTGHSFLIVEENPSRLMNFADYLCLLDAGQVVWSGTPDEARKSQDILKTYLGGH